MISSSLAAIEFLHPKMAELYTNIMASIRTYLSDFTGDGADVGNCWVIFDVDETLLTAYEKDGSVSIPKIGHIPIPQTISLYKWCKEQGFKVCIITARREWLRSMTIHRLIDSIGDDPLHSWNELWFKPSLSIRSDQEFKTRVRSIVAKKGTIVANIGDQVTDLRGGFSSAIFKLPNRY